MHSDLSHLPAFDAILFDMDGTLIAPLLDFAAIRAELGIAAADGILEALGRRDPAQAKADHARLREIELETAHRATLLDGAAELMEQCRELAIPTALLTRNTREAASVVMEKFPVLRFNFVRCREDGVIKPEPDGVLAAADALSVSPGRMLCEGDFKYDILAARAAGAPSVLITTSPNWREFSHLATATIHSLRELGLPRPDAGAR